MEAKKDLPPAYDETRNAKGLRADIVLTYLIEKTDKEKAKEIPVVQIDYGFFVTPIEDPKGLRSMDEVPRELRVSRPVLAMVNTQTSDGKAMMLPSKHSEEKYSTVMIIKFLEEQGLTGAGDEATPGVEPAGASKGNSFPSDLACDNGLIHACNLVLKPGWTPVE